jgi:hypothetical protein
MFTGDYAKPRCAKFLWEKRRLRESEILESAYLSDAARFSSGQEKPPSFIRLFMNIQFSAVFSL